MKNVYKIIISEKEREEIVKAIEWYDANKFDEQNKLQSIKIHLKNLPLYEEERERLRKQVGTMEQKQKTSVPKIIA